jgi:hypothetical protein
MRSVWGGAIAAGALFASGEAQASPEFDAFQEMCVAANGNPVTALRTASAKGWMPIPEPLMAGFPKEFSGSDGLMRTDRKSMYMMFVGVMDNGGKRDAVNMRFCAVAAMPGDSKIVAREIAEWVAVPPSKDLSEGGRTGFAYVEENGVRRTFEKPSDTEARTMLEAGKVRMIFVGEEKDMSLAMFAVPTL